MSTLDLTRSRHIKPTFTDEDEPTFSCWKCKDSPDGWILLRCPNIACYRPLNKHQPHFFAVRCTCWLQKHEKDIRESARAKIEKNKPAGYDFEAVCDLASGRYRYSQAVTL